MPNVKHDILIVQSRECMTNSYWKACEKLISQEIGQNIIKRA